MTGMAEQAKERAKYAAEGYDFGPDSITMYHQLARDVLALAAEVERLRRYEEDTEAALGRAQAEVGRLTATVEAWEDGSAAEVLTDRAEAADVEINRLTDDVARLMAALAASDETREAAESELRREWWLNHGHDYSSLYGDDGELQCNACLRDFKREPLDQLRALVILTRAALAVPARDSDATGQTPC